MSEYFGKEVPKLGFGLMRLPKKGEEIDVEQVKQMVDLFLEAGFTYFDTAYVYQGSEEAAKKALVERHPRECYTLATKINAMAAGSEKAAKEQFAVSLERTGAGYFDYYLLHALMEDNYKKYDEYHLWEFAKEQKDQGLIRHLGFSFHGGPQLLDRLLKEHPEVEFVQLQINYADWENPSVASRENYEVARQHCKPVVIMEPVKGGSLANPSAAVKQLFEGYHKDMSCASWAIRYAASLDGVMTVLSGMSDRQQMEDNLSYMKKFRPMDEEEQNIIGQVQKILDRSPEIPCTACHYCTEGCPKHIPIPEVFTAMNKHLGSGKLSEAVADYEKAVDGAGKASACIDCKQCERACPQHLEITAHLKQCARALEK